MRSFRLEGESEKEQLMRRGGEEFKKDLASIFLFIAHNNHSYP